MDDRKGTATTERCYGVTGTVWTGPRFCGYRAKAVDANGRPCCGHHLGKQEGIAWYGDRYRYPEGTGGSWRFTHGGQPAVNGRNEP